MHLALRDFLSVEDHRPHWEMRPWAPGLKEWEFRAWNSKSLGQVEVVAAVHYLFASDDRGVPRIGSGQCCCQIRKDEFGQPLALVKLLCRLDVLLSAAGASVTVWTHFFWSRFGLCVNSFLLAQKLLASKKSPGSRGISQPAFGQKEWELVAACGWQYFWTNFSRKNVQGRCCMWENSTKNFFTRKQAATKCTGVIQLPILGGSWSNNTNVWEFWGVWVGVI